MRIDPREGVAASPRDLPRALPFGSFLPSHLALHSAHRLGKGSQENQTKIAETGAIGSLVGIMGAMLPELQANSAECMGVLAHEHPTNQATIARTGAIGPLCNLLREGSEDKVKTRAAGALWALTIGNKPNKDTVTKLGGVDPLVGLIVTGESDESLAQAMGTLACLMHKHAENRENIAKLIVTRMANRAQLAQQVGGPERVLSAVSKMCAGSATNQAAIAKAGGVPPLILWLSGGGGDASGTGGGSNAEAQAAAATALLSMVSGNEHLQALISQSNGIPPLIELVSKGSLETQAAAARLLWHLAGNEAAGGEISAVGGMAPLCAMLAAKDVHAQELAATVISRLLKSNAAVCRTFEAANMPPLVQLLSTGSPTGQQQAACALAELALVSANRSTIAEVGGIEALVRLLTSTVVGTPETAARVLGNLARVEDDDGAAALLGSTTETKVVDASEVPEEDRKLSEGGQAEGEKVERVEGAEVDGGEAMQQDAAAKAAALAGVGSSAVILKFANLLSGASAGKEAGVGASVAANARRWARRPALRASAQQRRQRIVSAGGVRQLTVMLNAVSLERALVSRKMWELIAKVIGANPDAESKGMAAEGIEHTGQEQAASTLADLAADDEDMQRALIDAGCLPQMLTLIKSGSPEAQEAAARAILHLCATAESQALVVDGGAIVDLVGLCRHGNAAAQSVAAAVLSELARDATEERLAAIAAAGGIPPLVSLASTGSLQARECAAGALLHLSADLSICNSIAKAGGVSALAALLDDGPRASHDHAFGVLTRLAESADSSQTLIAKKLVSLLASESEGTQRRCAMMLTDLARKNAGAPVRIVNAGAISPLVSILSKKAGAAVEAAIGALGCLAAHEPPNQLAIATGLVKLLGTPEPEQAQPQLDRILARFAASVDFRVGLAEVVETLHADKEKPKPRKPKSQRPSSANLSPAQPAKEAAAPTAAPTAAAPTAAPSAATLGKPRKAGTARKAKDASPSSRDAPQNSTRKKKKTSPLKKVKKPTPPPSATRTPVEPIAEELEELEATLAPAEPAGSPDTATNQPEELAPAGAEASAADFSLDVVDMDTTEGEDGGEPKTVMVYPAARLVLRAMIASRGEESQAEAEVETKAETEASEHIYAVSSSAPAVAAKPEEDVVEANKKDVAAAVAAAGAAAIAAVAAEMAAKAAVSESHEIAELKMLIDSGPPSARRRRNEAAVSAAVRQLVVAVLEKAPERAAREMTGAGQDVLVEQRAPAAFPASAPAATPAATTGAPQKLVDVNPTVVGASLNVLGDRVSLVLSIAVGPLPADEDEQGAAILDSLRAGLRANHSRVLDLFRSWDKDGDGKVCVTPLFVSAPSPPFDPATFHAPPLAPPYVDRLAKRSCNAP